MPVIRLVVLAAMLLVFQFAALFCALAFYQREAAHAARPLLPVNVFQDDLRHEALRPYQGK
jgi:hypothetical protein